MIQESALPPQAAAAALLFSTRRWIRSIVMRGCLGMQRLVGYLDTLSQG